MIRPRTEQVLYGAAVSGLTGAICLIGYNVVAPNEQPVNYDISVTSTNFSEEPADIKNLDSFVSSTDYESASTPTDWQPQLGIGLLAVAFVAGGAGYVIDESRRRQSASSVSSYS